MEAEGSGWASLFWQCFRQSRNAMMLLDERRCIVDVNGACLRLVQHQRAALLGHPAHELVRDGPLFTAAQWRELLAQPQFTGSAELIHADGSRVTADEDYLRESIERPEAKVTAGYPSTMPSYQGIASEEQVVALVAYIKSQDGKRSQAR